jgi:hypothetical protein
LDEVQADPGSPWHVLAGDFLRTEAGVQGVGSPSLAVLSSEEEIGLVHAVVIRDNPRCCFGLTMRVSDAANLIRVSLIEDRCELYEVSDGVPKMLASASGIEIRSGCPVPMQMTIDDRAVVCAVNGNVVVRGITSRLAPAPDAAGIFAGEEALNARIRDFEIHPSRVRLPESLCCSPVEVLSGGDVLVSERFEGPRRPLDGKVTSTGSEIWTRCIGSGQIEVTGEESARVVGSPAQPNPGRTALSIPWHSPDLADLEVKMTVPGASVGEWHKPRGGFLFWQDKDNFLIVSLWRGDEYPGASVSTFLTADGFEELYDAVWTNIGRRAWYGDCVSLRVTFDGRQYIAEIDGNPVLYRRVDDFYPRLTRFAIRRVGIVANWEWGNDTGTVFREFVARGSRGSLNG